MYMIYGALAVLASMGLVYLMIILSHCLLLYSVALAKQKWLCYVAGLCCLASFKVEPFGSWQVGAVLASFHPAGVHLLGVIPRKGSWGSSRPQPFLLAASGLSQHFRGTVGCDLEGLLRCDFGNNPTVVMSCFGGFMLF